jgi:hypothetical protein
MVTNESLALAGEFMFPVLFCSGALFSHYDSNTGRVGVNMAAQRGVTQNISDYYVWHV